MFRTSRFRSKPCFWALLYAVIATSLSIFSAHSEGRLWLAEAGVHPFKKNISTLVDFSILNPLVILFLLRSWNLKIKALVKLRKPIGIKPYHVFGLSLLALTIGCVAMKLYVAGFLHGDFFDATIVRQNEYTFITLTGWVVFIFTALFISFVTFMIFLEVFYVRNILSLRACDVTYSPLHIDGSGGLSFLVRPSLNFVYAAIVIGIIFVVFVLQDHFIFQIKESNRLTLISIYVPFIFILLGLPILHLRRIMSEFRNSYLIAVGNAVEKAMKASNNQGFLEVGQAENYLSLVDCIDNYRKLASELPIWPLPTKSFVTPLSSALISLSPLVYKILKSAMENQ